MKYSDEAMGFPASWIDTVALKEFPKVWFQMCSVLRKGPSEGLLWKIIPSASAGSVT